MTRKPNLIFTLSEKLKKNLNFEPVFEQFKEYKELSNSDEHPRPKNHFQKKNESASPFFGRDRFDPAHKDSHSEELQHIHYWMEGCEWEFENDEPKAQWDCTSNTYLVYSYFKHNGTHYYYLIDFLIDTAHGHDGDYIPSVDIFIDQAKEYRLSVKNE